MSHRYNMFYTHFYTYNSIPASKQSRAESWEPSLCRWGRELQLHMADRLGKVTRLLHSGVWFSKMHIFPTEIPAPWASTTFSMYQTENSDSNTGTNATQWTPRLASRGWKQSQERLLQRDEGCVFLFTGVLCSVSDLRPLTRLASSMAKGNENCSSCLDTG